MEKRNANDDSASTVLDSAHDHAQTSPHTLEVQGRGSRRQFIRTGAAFVVSGAAFAASGNVLAADCDSGRQGQRCSDSDTGSSGDPVGCGQCSEPPKISSLSTPASSDRRIVLGRVKATG